MLIIAHRGASGHAPEHTFPAWDLALEMGADYLEQDLQMTRDGELIVMHDPTLDRTTDGSGVVSAHTLAQIKQLDAGSWKDAKFAGTRVPALREVFERYGTRVNYYIETKNPHEAPGMEEQLLALIDDFGLRDGAVQKWQVLVQSFSTASLLKIKHLDPQLPLIQLVAKDYGSAQIRERLPEVRSYAVGIGPAWTSIDGRLVEAAHEQALVVHPYTVNDPAEMQRMIALGVDGMFTDYPDRLREIVIR